jgi:flagellar hook-length control protein FliK
VTDIATVLAGSNPVSSAPAAPDAPTSSAPALDFLQLLTAQQATTPIVSTAAVQISSDPELLEEAEVLPDGSSVLPLAIPFAALDAKMFNAGLTAATDALAAATRNSSSSMNVSADLQLVTEMIEAEISITKEGANLPESFQLPNTQLDAVSKHSPHHDAISRPVQAPVGSSQWADEIGTRLTMMTEQGKHAASLRMSPEHLGPLEIRIAIRDDQASVWFGAAHADTRAAIEHALPRLRELFESQGMSLADAGVYREAPREQPGTARGFNGGERSGTSEESSGHAVRVSVGLVDAYA